MPADLYEVLGVERDASPQAIKAAYRRLSSELHPDRNKDPGASARMAEVNSAYSVLSDPEKRAEYDEGRDNPLRSAAIDALMHLMSELIESEEPDIYRAAQRKMDQAIQGLVHNRQMARESIRRLERRRELMRHKKKGGKNIFMVIFEKKMREEKAALERMDHQEQIVVEMRKVMEDYESAVEENKTVMDPAMQRAKARMDGMLERSIRDFIRRY